MAIDKKELHESLETICFELLRDIIEPACGVGEVMADFYLADIATYSLDDEEINQKVYDMIQEKYNLKEGEMMSIDSYTPLIQIALIILLGEYRPCYGPIDE